jgi:hypothetical protein
LLGVIEDRVPVSHKELPVVVQHEGRLYRPEGAAIGAAGKLCPPTCSGAAVRTGRIREAMIGLEVALSIVLLAGAGLMVKSLVRLLEVDVGFRTERLLTMDVNLAGAKYASAENHAAFYGQVLQRLETLPDAPCGLRTRRKPLC